MFKKFGRRKRDDLDEREDTGSDWSLPTYNNEFVSYSDEHSVGEGCSDGGYISLRAAMAGLG